MHQAQGALGDHPRGGAVARVTVAGHAGLQLPAVGGLADKQHVVEAVFALFLARAFAGLGRVLTGQGAVVGHRLGGGLALLAGAGEDHLVVHELIAVGVAQQLVGAVYVTGVDGRHHERRQPGVQLVVVDRLPRLRLLRALEARRQGKRVGEQLVDLRVLLGGHQGRLQAGGGTAGEGALHLAHPALHAGQVGAQVLLGVLLQEVHAHIERDRIKPAGKHDPRAARLGGLAVGVDHLAHPRRLAAQIHIVRTGLGAGRHQRLAVQLVRPHRGQHHAGALRQRLQGLRLVGVGGDQRHRIRHADFLAHRLQLLLAAAGHGPLHVAIGAVLLMQILRHQPAGEAAGAVHHDVELSPVAHNRQSVLLRMMRPL